MSGGAVTRRLLKASRLVRNKGICAFGEIVYRRLEVELNILARGRNKVVLLDGCRFPLRELPNLPMKLELLTGAYEQPERSAALRYIRPEWPVVELGGCFGVVACVTNKLLRNPEAHVVVEANPLVIPLLISNRNINHCSFKIVNRALAYDADTVTFCPERDFWGNSLYHNGGQPPVTVPATQLGQILREEGFEKFSLICDIEGQEYELVMRELDALGKAELIILEVHPHVIREEQIHALMSKLAARGFKTIDRSAQVIVLSKA
jgi:FkbM family methyltransferase